MYKKYLIIASKKDKAGINITTALSQFRKNPLLSGMSEQPNFDFYLVEGETIFNESLEQEKIEKYDFVIFASKHASEKGGKTLSVHAPGNFRTAQFGGESGKLCKSSALFQKQLFEQLNKKAKENLLNDYQITLECTHHGPLINKPCVYIEIGATETEWGDRRAAFAVAQTIRDTIENFKLNPYNEIAIGIGGPHYCPNFNILQSKSNYAFSHIIPEYSLPLSEEIIKEAIEKTEEEVDLAILDWKGLAGAEERERILKILDKLYIRHKRTSEVKKEI
jgi:D-aminoacyl-tRNA deacylase